MLEATASPVASDTLRHPHPTVLTSSHIVNDAQVKTDTCFV